MKQNEIRKKRNANKIMYALIRQTSNREHSRTSTNKDQSVSWRPNAVRAIGRKVDIGPCARALLI